MVAKSEQVRSFFEQPQQYLRRRAFEIRIRAETVKEFTKHSAGIRILDIGCGDGSISLPLLTETTRVTLVDMSANMLSIARSKVPPKIAKNVEAINQDFTTAQLEERSFDLILCIGVLAHVVSPDDFIAKIVSLLKPGGSIVVECTDARHILTRAVSGMYKVRALLKPMMYPLNALSYSQISTALARYRVQPKMKFRYVAPFPGSYRLFSQDRLYRFTRRVFGSAEKNRNAYLGNEYIALFTMSA